MFEDTVLMESADALGRVQHGPDIRMGNAENDGRQQFPMPLGPRVALTGYRLLATIVIVGTGIPKAVYSYYGQSLISPTLDFLGGVVFGLLLFWLGIIEVTSPELCPCFFQVDLAPAILRSLRRDRTPSPSPVFVSHHPAFPIPSIPATCPSTDSRDPNYRDAVTALPCRTQPSPRTMTHGGAQPVGQNSSYLDMNDREVDLADCGDEECLENAPFTCLRGDRQAFGPSVRDSWPSEFPKVPSTVNIS